MEKEIYKAIINYDINTPAVLCSLIQWTGSVPRKDYPLMLVSSDESIIGTIGGGRMEYDVIEKAKELILTNSTVLAEFDLTSKVASSDQGICGGTIKVLIEPFTEQIQSFYTSMDFLLGHKGLYITHFDKEKNTSSRYWIKSLEQISDHNTLKRNLIKSVFKDNIHRSIEDSHQIQLVQSILPLPILHIFGAGHVGNSVATLSKFIDLKTHVYDDRSKFLTEDRFPHSVIINIDYSSNLDDYITVNPQDYILVATRGHKHDLEIMRWLLDKKVQYLSLISSVRKWTILKQALRSEGYSDNILKTVHSPVGLDIDAETVPEIAVSIISEIIHHYRKGVRSSLSLSTSHV